MVDDCSNTRLSLLTKTHGGPIGIFVLARFYASICGFFLSIPKCAAGDSSLAEIKFRDKDHRTDKYSAANIFCLTAGDKSGWFYNYSDL